MARQKKQFFILLGILVVILIIYGIVMSYNEAIAEKEESQKEAETIYVNNINIEEIVSFSYTYDNEVYSYTKNEEIWTYDGDTSLDLDEATIENMLVTAVNLTAEEAVSEYDSLDAYGFSEPKKTITLVTENDIYTMKIGDYNEIVGWYYLIEEGDELLYLVDSNIVSVFDVFPENFVVEEEIETEEVEKSTE